MKIRTIVLLWTLALILGFCVYALKRSQGDEQKNVTNREAGEKLIPDFSAQRTETIKISGANESVTINKTDGAWVVAERDGFPADSRKINDLLRTLGELRVIQGIEAGPSFAPRFGMDEKSSDPEKHGITVSFENSSGTELAKLSFGKILDAAASSSRFGGGGSTGRYIRNHNDESGFYAVDELFSSLTADPKTWLKDEFVKVERIESISLTKPGSDENEWELTRDNENAEFKFTEAFAGVKVDPAAVSPLKSLFSFARFDDVVPASEVEKRETPDKLQKAKITTFEGLTYDITLQPAKPTGDRTEAAAESYLMTVSVSGELPEERKKVDGETEDQAKAADTTFTERRDVLAEQLETTKKLEGRVFEVSKFTVDALLKNRNALMHKGPGPGKATPPPSPGTSAFSPPIEIPARPAPDDQEAPSEQE